MLSREEIEEGKELLKTLAICTLDKEEEKKFKNLKIYIEYLEARQQKLMDMLEEEMLKNRSIKRDEQF